MNFLYRYSSYLVPLAFLLSAGVGLLGWTLHPAGPRWMLLPTLYLLVLLVDRANAGWAHPEREGAFNQTRFALRLFISLTALVTVSVMLMILATSLDFIEVSTALSLRKAVYIAMSLVMIVMGNFIPKLPSPWHHAAEPFDWQGVHRFAGMVMMLGGTVSLAAWLFMSPEEARGISRFCFAAMAVLTVGRKWYSLSTRSDRRGVEQA